MGWGNVGVFRNLVWVWSIFSVFQIDLALCSFSAVCLCWKTKPITVFFGSAILATARKIVTEILPCKWLLARMSSTQLCRFCKSLWSLIDPDGNKNMTSHLRWSESEMAIQATEEGFDIALRPQRNRINIFTDLRSARYNHPSLPVATSSPKAAGSWSAFLKAEIAVKWSEASSLYVTITLASNDCSLWRMEGEQDLTIAQQRIHTGCGAVSKRRDFSGVHVSVHARLLRFQ